MEKKRANAGISEEAARLQEENVHLRREIAIEERVARRWQALAGIFQDTLANALRRYDPAYYEKLQNCASERAAQTDGKREKMSADKPQCTLTKLQETGEETQANPKARAFVSQVQSEARTLRKENEMLSEVLAAQIKQHRRWEQTAVRFHDTLWQVLFKYEPDTYGEICPAQAKESTPDFSGLLELVENVQEDTNEKQWRDADAVFDKNVGRGV